jgi:hypothetical protein
MQPRTWAQCVTIKTPSLVKIEQVGSAKNGVTAKGPLQNSQRPAGVPAAAHGDLIGYMLKEMDAAAREK